VKSQAEYSVNGSSGPWFLPATAPRFENLRPSTYAYDLSPGTTYWWKAVYTVVDRSWGICLESPLTEWTSNVLKHTQPSPATLSTNRPNATSLDFTWDNPATYSGYVTFGSYQLQESVNGTLYQIAAAGTNESMMRYNLTGLAPGTSYAFRLNTTDACNNCGAAYNSSSYSNIAYTGPPTPYSITFVESGLAKRTNWSVQVGGLTVNSTGNSIVFREENRTYLFRVSPVSGYSRSPPSGSVKVRGGPIAVAVSFTELTYSVTFDEYGLPSGSSWAVVLVGATSNSSGPSISFSEPNGTYPFAVQTVSNYSASPPSGSVGVSGNASYTTVNFTLVTYSVEFVETGPLGGATWSVLLAGSARSGSGSSIAFAEPNGTFAFTVDAVSGYAVSPSAGSLAVSGGTITEPVTFLTLTPVYTVYFTEAGLANGAAWSVTMADRTEISTDTSVAFTEPNGRYPFSVNSPSGFEASPSSGWAEVSGSGMARTIAFTPIPFAVTFTESGLPSGTDWSVVLAGAIRASNGASISFAVPNGTYSFSLITTSGYSVSPASGTISVLGESQSMSIRFAKNSSSARVIGPLPTEEFELLSGVFVGTAIGVAVGLALWRRHSSGQRPL